MKVNKVNNTSYSVAYPLHQACNKPSTHSILYTGVIPCFFYFLFQTWLSSLRTPFKTQRIQMCVFFFISANTVGALHFSKFQHHKYTDPSLIQTDRNTVTQVNTVAQCEITTENIGYYETSLQEVLIYRSHQQITNIMHL